MRSGKEKLELEKRKAKESVLKAQKDLKKMTEQMKHRL